MQELPQPLSRLYERYLAGTATTAPLQYGTNATCRWGQLKVGFEHLSQDRKDYYTQLHESSKFVAKGHAVVARACKDKLDQMATDGNLFDDTYQQCLDDDSGGVNVRSGLTLNFNAISSSRHLQDLSDDPSTCAKQLSTCVSLYGKGLANQPTGADILIKSPLTMDELDSFFVGVNRSGRTLKEMMNNFKMSYQHMEALNDEASETFPTSVHYRKGMLIRKLKA